LGPARFSDALLRRPSAGKVFQEDPQQLGGEGLAVPTLLRSLQGDRARCGLDRDRGVAVAQALVVTLAAGLALGAQELGHLRLQGHLEQERDPDSGYLLQDLAQLTAGVEELIDPSAAAFAGRYSL